MKWTLPSALSADGETVAALAVHIDEAELKAESSCGAVGRLPDNLLIAALETHFTQQTQIRPRLRRQNACTKPRSAEGFHFIQPLQRRLFRVRETIAVILRGFIADGESGVVVRRADRCHQSLLQNQTYVLTGSVIRMAGPAIPSPEASAYR